MKNYYVNNNQTNNPGLHHEVHTTECHLFDLIKSKTKLGEYSSCASALVEAKKIYSDADGCKHCCPSCHKG